MVKVYQILAGNTLNSHQAFWQLLTRRLNAEQVRTVEDCDVTLTFCPIVSRVGTDIEAAIKLIPGSRPGVLVALHPTFNPEYVVPDTGRFVPRSDILTVNCLFHDGELLHCNCNDRAYNEVYEWLKKFQPHSYQTNPHQPHSYETDPLQPGPYPQGETSHHNGPLDCLDAVQHPKYLIVGLAAIAVGLLVIAVVLLVTNFSR